MPVHQKMESRVGKETIQVVSRYRLQAGQPCNPHSGELRMAGLRPPSQMGDFIAINRVLNHLEELLVTC